jgi:hypothetical protein
MLERSTEEGGEANTAQAAQPTRISPSEFMREHRPENYSDSESRETYRLDRGMFEYYLDSITARNETHDFELFCRKLCERTICPHLRPQTGPEGGGDGKADTETLPVADEIAIRAYVGEPNGDKERWAFAFSAKKTWTKKVRDDVKGLVETGRGYDRIFAVTSRFARAKDRAKLEDELKQTYGLPITILDRSWIVEEVIDKDRRDLAYDYLGVGEPIKRVRRGPADYSRTLQLEDIERTLADPTSFAGLDMQAASEALVAAKLSRVLERPQHETEGRFLRAIKMADAGGTERQKLEARYEQIWTSCWWFDDIEAVNAAYDGFEALVIENDHAQNLEFLTNLLAVISNAVLGDETRSAHFALADRSARLVDRLEAMAANPQRPTNQLEARTLLLVVRGRQAMHARDLAAISALWPDFSAILHETRGLTEFDALRFVKLVEVFGPLAGDDGQYTALMEEVATFISERASEGAGALVLLKRARQLGDDAPFEKIRLLGRATPRLAKKEHLPELAEAARLLAEAYSHAGLLWAARASCLFAAAALVMQSDEDSELPADIIGVMFLFTLTAQELHHLPDFIAGVQFLQACGAVLPLTDESKEKVRDNLETLDRMMGAALLNLDGEDLSRLVRLPDGLEPCGLFFSRAALLFALGHGDVLRQDGTIPPTEDPADMAELFAEMARHGLPAPQGRFLHLNPEARQHLRTTVVGVRVSAAVSGSETSILVGEAVLGALEAFAATAIDLGFVPHVETFEINVVEMDGLSTPTCSMGLDGRSVVVNWPRDLAPPAVLRGPDASTILIEVAAYTLAATCHVKDFGESLDKLHADERVHERLAMIGSNANAYNRIFGRPLTRLAEWVSADAAYYDVRPERPDLGKETRSNRGQTDAPDERRPLPEVKDHRQLAVRSVIDVHAWNQAGWSGVAYLGDAWDKPFTVALLFTNQEAANRIFQQWRDRFGPIDEHDDIYLAFIRDVFPDNPFAYRVLITSRPTADSDLAVYTSRYHTMEPTSPGGLDGFLEVYPKTGAYDLVPAIYRPDGGIGVGSHLAIRKRALTVKRASEVTEYDMEIVALPRRGEEDEV